MNYLLCCHNQRETRRTDLPPQYFHHSWCCQTWTWHKHDLKTVILGPTYHTWHQARRWNIRRNNSFYTNIQVNITLYLQDYNSSTLSLRSTFNIRVGYDIWLDCMLDQWCWCWYVLPVTSHCHWLYWQEERAEDSRTLVTADQGLSSSVLCHRVLVLVLCCRDTEDETNIMINDTESRI